MDYLGQMEANVPETYDIDDLKNVKGYTYVRTQLHSDPKHFFNYGPDTASYTLYPWNWVDLPRNYLEDAGTTKLFSKTSGGTPKVVKVFQAVISSGVSLIDEAAIGQEPSTTYGVEWSGRAILFKDHQKYINTLSLVKDPLDYIRFLKLAPLAGFNISFTGMVKGVPRERQKVHRDGRIFWEREPFNAALPPKVFQDWWMEAVTWDVLSMTFDNLRASQIEDLPDLYGYYMNSGKYIDQLRSEMRSPVPVTVQPAGFAGQSTSFTVSLELAQWEIELLEMGIKKVYALYEENRKPMAARIIQLQDVNATIDPTAFSTDPHQNPYLVYNPERSDEELRPIFTNIARNPAREAGTWVPPEVAGRPENYQYWQQVPEFTAQHQRNLVSEYGPVSQADIENYGLQPRRTNWLPWIVAGGAAAYAASQLM